jgi:hypothetical protein
MDKTDPKHPCNIPSEELYKRSTLELLTLARAVGVNFPVNYHLPYEVSRHSVNSDNLYRYNIEDHNEAWEHAKTVRFAGMMNLYSIMCRGSCVTNFFDKIKAEEFKDTRNKRHVIIAMLSNDPKHPVLI